MNCQLHWTPHIAVSALHAAASMDAGLPLVDTRMSTPLREPLHALVELVDVLRIPRPMFWQHAIPVAGMGEGSRHWAEIVLHKTCGRADDQTRLTDTLSGCFRDLTGAFSAALPGLVDELALRTGPLRQQWEARGPGMLRVISRLTDPSLIVPQVNLFVVHSATGGGGAAHLSYNSARVEAVLANPIADLPEATRLAWLVSQLNNDLSVHGEHISGLRLPLVSGLAMIGPVLHAAHEVELLSDVSQGLPVAVESWLAGIGAPNHEWIGIVDDWWNMYCATRPAWNIALGALDRMLP